MIMKLKLTEVDLSTEAIAPGENISLFPSTSSGNIIFPTLTSCDTIDTDASGVLSCGTDGTINIFDQDLNTTDNVVFNRLNVTNDVFFEDGNFIVGRAIVQSTSNSLVHFEKTGSGDNAEFSLSRTSGAQSRNVSIIFRVESITNDETGAIASVLRSTSASDLILYSRNANLLNKVLTLESDGDVGIGTENPTHTLNIVGDLNVTVLGAATATDLCINGGVLSACSSSSEVKENIIDLPNGTALTIINLLKPKQFNFIDNPGRRIGLLAEDVLEVDPRLIYFYDFPIYNYTNFTYLDSSLDENGTELFSGLEKTDVIKEIVGYESKITGVNYRQELVTLNVQAIQDLHDLIEVQRAEIDSLKADVELLKADVCSKPNPPVGLCP